MGTRSLTIVKDEQGEELLCMYRQYDGYLDGHGQELVDFLKRKRVVNGISGGDVRDEIFNGMGCLAAQVVSLFKEVGRPGGFYLYPPGNRDLGEEYVYTISFVELYNPPSLKIETIDYSLNEDTGKHERGWKTLFEGYPTEFNMSDFMEPEEEDEEQ